MKLFGSLVVCIGSYCHFVDPYEDEPTVRLTSALGSKEAWTFPHSSPHPCCLSSTLENKHRSSFLYLFSRATFSLSLVLFPPDTFYNLLFLFIASLDSISADICQNTLIHKIVKRCFFFSTYRYSQYLGGIYEFNYSSI